MILVFFSLLWFNPALRQPQRGPSRSSPQPHQQPESPPLHRSAFSWFYILWPVTCPSGLDNLPRDILSDPLPVPGLQPFLSPHQKSLESCWILGTQAQAHVGQALLPRGQLRGKAGYKPPSLRTRHCLRTTRKRRWASSGRTRVLLGLPGPSQHH